MLERGLEIQTETLGQSSDTTQFALKAMGNLCDAWHRPARAALYTARLERD